MNRFSNQSCKKQKAPLAIGCKGELDLFCDIPSFSKEPKHNTTVVLERSQD
jgi:hypothetical protein